MVGWGPRKRHDSRQPHKLATFRSPRHLLWHGRSLARRPSSFRKYGAASAGRSHPGSIEERANRAGELDKFDLQTLCYLPLCSHRGPPSIHHSLTGEGESGLWWSDLAVILDVVSVLARTREIGGRGNQISHSSRELVSMTAVITCGKRTTTSAERALSKIV